MKKEELENLSNEKLKKKEKDIKVLIGIFILLILGLLYFGFRDYFNGETNSPLTIITICTIGGLVSVLPGLKSIQEELRNRN